MSLHRESYRRTKILVTVGPSSQDEQTLRKLIGRGVDGFRFNFSHGTMDDFRPQLNTIRSLSDELGHHVTCLADLQGPKIRVGKLEDEPLTLEKEQTVLLFASDSPPDELSRDVDARLPIAHSSIVDDCQIDSTIYVNEGQVTLTVEEKTENSIVARVQEAGTVWSDKGINLPDSEFSVPPMTPKDERDLEAIVREDFDMVALSFVRQASDLDKAREILDRTDRAVDLLAKIESQKALRNLEGIISAVEGIIVARGDLGVEIGPERVPYQQKRMIREANRRGRIVITATQMLETMIDNSLPTRAEVSDVANAVLDGSDVVMLSGETAIGQNPVRAAETMSNIVRATETDFREELAELAEDLDELDVRIGATMSNAATRVANEIDAQAIVAPTSSGFTARMISKTSPLCPIVTLSFNESTLQKTALYRNVIPYPLEKINDTGVLIEKTKTVVKDLGFADPGDKIVLLAGLPIDQGGVTNLLHVIELE